MMYQPTLRDVTYQCYPFQYSPAVSSEVGEMDKNDVWDNLLSTLIREKRFRMPFLPYQSLVSLLETDWSSVWPHFEIKNETSLIEERFETTIPEDMVEFDIIVRMPPMKEWTARLKVRGVEKATPHIVEPEEI